LPYLLEFLLLSGGGAERDGDDGEDERDGEE
jgi:hypothetical protein